MIRAPDDATRWTSISECPQRMVFPPAPAPPRLHDVAQDPAEERDLLAGRPSAAARLAARLRAILDGMRAPMQPVAVDFRARPEVRRALEDTGYVGGDEDDAGAEEQAEGR
jgi:hypothetical protein